MSLEGRYSAATLIAVLLLAALSLGCATGYTESKTTKVLGMENVVPGYSEVKLTDDTYIVNFVASAYTPMQKVQMYLFYRCAEVTENNGFRYFQILDDKDMSTTTPEPLTGMGNVKAPHLSATIRLLKEKSTAATQVYEAAEIKKNIGPQLQKK